MSHLFSIIADKLCLQSRVSLLLSSLNDAFVDIVDGEGSFEFSPIAEFTSHLHVHITLAADTEATSLRLVQLLKCQKHAETLNIQIDFKRIIA